MVIGSQPGMHVVTLFFERPADGRIFWHSVWMTTEECGTRERIFDLCLQEWGSFAQPMTMKFLLALDGHIMASAELVNEYVQKTLAIDVRSVDAAQSELGSVLNEDSHPSHSNGGMKRNEFMGTITVRNLPDEVHRALQVRAAHHGRSTEAEIRDILEQAAKPEGRLKLGSLLTSIAHEAGGLTDAEVEQINYRDKAPHKPMSCE